MKTWPLFATLAMILIAPHIPSDEAMVMARVLLLFGIVFFVIELSLELRVSRKRGPLK